MSSDDLPFDAAEIQEHLAGLLRESVQALPGERLGVAKRRIQDPDHDPGRLIAFVSAVEGFARSLCMHQRAKTERQRDEIYPGYEKRGPQSLIGEYLSLKGIDPPREHFGVETWRLFGYAVEYRNLLAHQGTYLAIEQSPQLIDACRKVLQALANDEGLSADDI